MAEGKREKKGDRKKGEKGVKLNGLGESQTTRDF